MTTTSKAIGFNISKGVMHSFVASKGEAGITLVGKAVTKFDPDESIGAIMGKLNAAFVRDIQESGAEVVAYRMHNGRGMTQEQIALFHYPWGLLHLVASQGRLPCVELTGNSMTAKRFGLERGTKPMEAVDKLAGAPAKWSDAQRYAACAAWGALVGPG